MGGLFVFPLVEKLVFFLKQSFCMDLTFFEKKKTF